MIFVFIAGETDQVGVSYVGSRDRVLFTSSQAVGVRKDLNGILLLDTALQTPVARSEDVVTVELPLPEVRKKLCKLAD